MGTLVLFLVLFLFAVEPARAPKGGRKNLGGRTIASLQEEDFDRALHRYEVCYGVRLEASLATPERRRVCKALLVHELNASLEAPGSYLEKPLVFRCHNTSLGRRAGHAEGDEEILLQPNREQAAIHEGLSPLLRQVNVSAEADREVRDACGFVSRCQRAMGLEGLSLRQLGSCLADRDALHQRLMGDTFARLLFPRSSQGKRLLAASLLR
ncbi:MAG: hypothetical protein HUU37_06365, partial [Bdellovibrionales bacterium]|nr:hypothetical protein [Bdellovibrionales bacterium]